MGIYVHGYMGELVPISLWEDECVDGVWVHGCIGGWVDGRGSESSVRFLFMSISGLETDQGLGWFNNFIEGFVQSILYFCLYV